MPTPSMYQPRKNRRALWIALAVIAAALAAYLLFGRGQGSAEGGFQMPPPAVSVVEVKQEDVPLEYEYAGRTAGSREVEIRARVSGILERRAYTEGQRVKKGQLLFVIDPAPFAATQAEAKARFARAQSDWKRVQGLYKEKAVSAREYDEARAAYEETKAALQTTSISLGYTTVTAPISGVTSREALSEGSLVTANTSLLTRISQLDPIYVNFSAPDAEFLRQRREIAEGTVTAAEGKLQAEIVFGDGSVYGEPGVIDFTDSIIDPATGSVSARAVVPNEQGAILPGQFVRVRLKGLIRPNAIAIPDMAVMQGPQGTFVYVVNEESKAVVRPVQLGQLNGKQRIVLNGLQPGDKVITEGLMKVRPDAPVNTAPPPAPGQAPAEGKQ